MTGLLSPNLISIVAQYDNGNIAGGIADRHSVGEKWEQAGLYGQSFLWWWTSDFS